MPTSDPQARWAREARAQALLQGQRHGLSGQLKAIRITGRRAEVPGRANYALLFWQDCSREVRFGVRRLDSANDLHIQLRGADEAWKHTIGWALDGNDGDFERGALHWLEAAAAQIAWSGEACFEIAQRGVPPDQSKVTVLVEDVGLKGRIVTPVGLAQVGYAWGDLHGPKLALNWVKNSVLHVIPMPPQLGGSLGHRAMMLALSGVRLGPPSWVPDAISHGDLSTYVTSSDEEWKRIAAARLTRLWGWDCRSALSHRASGPYLRERMSRWTETTSFLRDHLVTELGKLVRRLGCPGTVALEPEEAPGGTDLVEPARTGEPEQPS